MRQDRTTGRRGLISRRRFAALAAAGVLLPGAAARAQVLAPLGGLADAVVVRKAERRLALLRGGRPFRSYRVALGRQPGGAKQREGDGRTPEGRYVIDGRNPESRYYLALHISYPNQYDLLRAVAQGAPAGGDIMIHGIGLVTPVAAAQHPERDWTEGCIAVTNREIEEIWFAVADGTPIDILP